MKTTIEVEDRKEAELIKRGLRDPATRALVKITGAFARLPTDEIRRRALTFAAKTLADGTRPKAAGG